MPMKLMPTKLARSIDSPTPERCRKRRRVPSTYLVCVFTVVMLTQSCGSSSALSEELTEAQELYCEDRFNGDEIIEAAQDDLGVDTSLRFERDHDRIWDDWDGDIAGDSYVQFQQARLELASQQDWFPMACAWSSRFQIEFADDGNNIKVGTWIFDCVGDDTDTASRVARVDECEAELLKTLISELP